MNLLNIFCLVHQKFDSFKRFLVETPYSPGIQGSRNVDWTNWFHTFSKSVEQLFWTKPIDEIPALKESLLGLSVTVLLVTV